MALSLIVPSLDSGLAGSARLGLVRAAPVAVGPSSPALESEIETTRAGLAAAHAGHSPAEIPGLEPARRLYRSFGIDPTRTRPSSEALLRRLLQGKPLPRIVNAVDLCNLCALWFLLPIGLYDAETIHGAVTLRRGGAGESYAGVRKEIVHLEGRPVLSDDEGPFGNPTADSMRTCVTPATRSLLMVVFAPAMFPAEELQANIRRAATGMQRYLAPADATVATETHVIP